MKLFAITTAAILATTPAMADGLGVFGHAEYAFDAEAYEAGIGVDYTVDELTLSTELTVVSLGDAFHDWEYSNLNLGVDYAVTDVTTVYLDVDVDPDHDHEATVGVAFRF